MEQNYHADEGHANDISRAVTALNKCIEAANRAGLRVDVSTIGSNRVGLPPQVIVQAEVSRLYQPRPEPRMSPEDFARALQKDNSRG